MDSDSKTPVFNDLAATNTETAVPFDKAMTIFDEVADRTDIAFGYAADGCYARAQLACLIMNARGLTPKKAWAFESGNSLSVKKPDGETI
jgi:glutaminase-like protein